MSIFTSHYPQIESTRLHIEARIKHLQDKLFSRKPTSDQLNHEQLQYNIVNIYNMMKETADNQTLLQKELGVLKGQGVADSTLETRIYRLEIQRKQAEEKAFTLQRQLDGYNRRDQKERLLGYELSSNKRLLDMELDNRINLYKMSLEEDSRRVYEGKMRGVIEREELELEQLRRDREAFEKSYNKLGLPDFGGRSTGSKYEAHSFGGNYYGDSGVFGTGGKYEQRTDYKGGHNTSAHFNNNSLRKQDDQTQPSPSKLRYEEEERRERKTNSDRKDDYQPSRKYVYDHARDNTADIRDKQSKSDIKKSNQDVRNPQNHTLDIQDLKPRYTDSPQKPNNPLLDKQKYKEQDSNPDSLQQSKNQSARKKPPINKNNSLSGSIQKNKSKKQNKYRGDPTFYDRYMNIKITQKSPSRKRNDKVKGKEVERNALERIRTRIMTSWAVYEDSSLRNTKHEKDHLYNTYKLESKMRKEIKEKLDSNEIVERKFGFIVD